MEYRACVEELLFSSQVQHMKSIRHHPGVSCYEHSVFVSYVAWYLADRWGADARTAARAGLLHDLYLYDPRTLPSYRQCFAHPVAPAENAAALCGGLCAAGALTLLAGSFPVLPAWAALLLGLWAPRWPLARRAPRSREAAAVCLADKLCATAEIMQIWRNLGLRRAVLSGA